MGTNDLARTEGRELDLSVVRSVGVKLLMPVVQLLNLRRCRQYGI